MILIITVLTVKSILQ